MTFIVKTRGAGGFLLADYRCPEHGVFETTVQRDENGDAPDEVPCPASLCLPECHDDDPLPCSRDCGHTCGVTSPWTASTVLGKVKRGEFTRGKSDERPPRALDTSLIADGMSTSEWRERRAKIRKDELRKTVKEKTGW